MRIRLGGTVVDNDSAALYRRWGYNDVCCPKDVRDAAAKCPEGEDLIFELNSPGGSVYQGFEMYTVIRGYRGQTVAEVHGLAASAMSVAMAACGKVLMSPVAQVMLHRASVYARGNSEVMVKTKQWLDTIDESILNAYTEKSNGKRRREDFAEMMRSETFMTAQDAVACGLADGILEAAGGVDPAKAAACAWPQAGILELPPVEDLLRREREWNTANKAETAAEPSAQPEGGPQAGAARNEEAENNRRSERAMEIENKEQLEEKYPELTAQIAREAAEAAAKTAAKAERERIAGIDAMAMPGFEDIIGRAKADPEQDAGTVAQAMILAQKKSGGAYLAQVKQDAGDSHVNEVPAASLEAGAGVDSGEETLDQAAKAAVEAWKKEGAEIG